MYHLRKENRIAVLNNALSICVVLACGRAVGKLEAYNNPNFVDLPRGCILGILHHECSFMVSKIFSRSQLFRIVSTTGDVVWHQHTPSFCG